MIYECRLIFENCSLVAAFRTKGYARFQKDIARLVLGKLVSAWIWAANNECTDAKKV